MIRLTTYLARIAIEKSNRDNELLELNHSLEEKVSERTRELKEANKKLVALANFDSLTKALNRRYFMELSGQELKKAARYNGKFGLLAMDIDFFKSINDGYGHSAGDAVLIQFCKVCKRVLRSSDLFGRFGGEEFLAILPENDLKATTLTADRIRLEVENMNIHWNSDHIKCTVSIGTTEFRKNDKSLDALIQRADAALYRSKESGRNRVTEA